MIDQIEQCQPYEPQAKMTFTPPLICSNIEENQSIQPGTISPDEFDTYRM